MSISKYILLAGAVLVFNLNNAKAQNFRTVFSSDNNQGEFKMAEDTGVWSKTKEVTSDMWEGTKSVTGDVWDGAKKVTGDIYDGGKKVGSDISDAIDGNASTPAPVTEPTTHN